MTKDWHRDQAALDFISLELVSVLGHQDLHSFMSYAAGPCIPRKALNRSTTVLRAQREAGKSLGMPTLKAAAFITLFCAPVLKPT